MFINTIQLVRKTKDCTEIATIVKRLPGLPLAIAQSGDYNYKTGNTPKKCPDTHEVHPRSILTQNNDITYANGFTMAALQISYDAVKTRSPSAFKLLTLLGFPDNSGVCWELLLHLAWICKASFAES